MALVDKEPLILPYQAAAEYLAGVDDAVAGLHGLVSSFALSRPSEAHILEAARLAGSLRRRPPWGDIHIAAVALLESTYVLTANPKDFAALGCRVWDYRNQAKAPE